MMPDEKYMSESNSDDNDIRFVPPSFMNRNAYSNNSSNDNYRNLDLFPSETGFPEICFYSHDVLGENSNYNIANDTIPSTFDILRNLDVDLNENVNLERINNDCDINKIYFKIERRHPGIFATLYAYRIPRPIVKAIIKRLIRLTLAYCKGDN